MDSLMDIDRLFLSWPVIPICECLSRLKVADALPLDGSAVSVVELAEKTGFDADFLYRLMRITSSAGVFHESEGRKFAHNDSSRRLVTGGDMSYKLGVHCNQDALSIFSQLESQLKDPTKSAFEFAFNTPYFRRIAQQPAKMQFFAEYMAMRGAIETPLVLQGLQSYMQEQVELFVDIGGSVGQFALELCKSKSRVRAVVFELPEVVQLGRNLQMSAVGHFAQYDESVRSRVSFVEGDFFKLDDFGKVADADVFFLKYVFDDWSNEQCSLILSNLHAKMKPSARAIVCDTVLRGERNQPSEAYIIDFTIGTLVNGRERSEEEWRSLIPTDKFHPTFSEVLVEKNFLRLICLQKK